MSKLRTYAPMRRVSKKVKAGDSEFRAVYAVVDARSGGRCEVNLLQSPNTRCTKRATDHHHLYKPRRSNHEPLCIIHVCRDHHDRMEWPYKRGRLTCSFLAGEHRFSLVFAKDKFEFIGKQLLTALGEPR